MKTLFLLIPLSFLCLSTYGQGSITVKINEVESDDGKVIVSLYTQKDGFPMEKEKAFKRVKLYAQEGEMSCAFSSIPYGTYAVSIIHDENDDDEVDRNLIGMPKERVGASNHYKFGRPSFDVAKFELSASDPDLNIDMVFLN